MLFSVKKVCFAHNWILVLYQRIILYNKQAFDSELIHAILATSMIHKLLLLLVGCLLGISAFAQPDPPPPPACWRFANFLVPAHDTAICVNSNPIVLQVDTLGGTFVGPNVSNGVFTPAATGTYRIFYIHPDTCVIRDSVDITVNGTLNGTLSITGADTVCSSDLSSIYSTNTLSGAISYTWSISPALNTIISDNTLLIDWANQCGPVTISASAANGCGSTPLVTKTVQRICLNPIIATAGPYCATTDTFHLTTNTPGGTWSGCNITPDGVFTPSTVGSCTVNYVVTLANCVAFTSTNLVVGPQAIPTISAPPQGCVGTTVTLNASPQGGVWQPSLSTPLQSGSNNFTYTVSAPFGCSGAAGVTINAIEPPIAGFGYNITNCKTICVGDQSINANSWTWDFGDGEMESDNCHTYADSGTYCITQIAVNSCGSDTAIQCVFVGCTGIAELANEGGIRVYPNPAQDVVTIAFDTPQNTPYTITLLDITGKALFSKIAKGISAGSNYKLDLSGLAKGVYTMRLATDKGHSINKQIIVN